MDEELLRIIELFDGEVTTADKIARTAITTTSSTSENPSSPGFLERALLALGLFKYACNGVIFKKWVSISYNFHA